MLVLLSLQPPAPADKLITQGEYVDKSGGAHAWHINTAHTLIWGGQPYIPAGGVFQSRYLSDAPSDSNWAADVADLEKLKKHGIHSIILVCSGVTGGLTQIDSVDFQRIITYLDDNGFDYGINVADFPRQPLQETIVLPAVYRVQSPSPGNATVFSNISGLVGGRYYLVAQADGSIIASGAATVIDAQTASVTVPTGAGGPGTVLILFPKRVLLQESLDGAHLPNIWANTDDYRDSLLIYFNRIHFGKGLRFFVDPIVDDFGFFGEAVGGSVPTDKAFQIQFQAWLQNRYGKSLLRLNNSWGVKDQDVTDFASAARSVALWYGSKGIQTLYDEQADKLYNAEASRSQYWSDMLEFRAYSMLQVMDELALALKKGVADVPVIYRWSRPTPGFVDKDNAEGFDGYLVDSQEHGSHLADDAGARVLSAAEQDNRTEWLLAQLSSMGPDAKPSYTSQSDLENDSTSLRGVGVKGYYIDSLRRLTPDERSAGSILDADGHLLDYVHQDQATYSIDSSSMADFVPGILFFPSDLTIPGMAIRQFQNGVWWLPSYSTGEALKLGPGLAGYSMVQPDRGRLLVLWSPGYQTRTPQFRIEKISALRMSVADGTTIAPTQRKGIVSFPVTSVPVLLSGIETLPLTDDASDQAQAETKRLLAMGKATGIPMDPYDQQLYYIQHDVLIKDTPDARNTAYLLISNLNIELENVLSPYVWVEGESATEQTFNGVVTSDAASGGAYLWVDSDSQRASGDFHATYDIDVSVPEEYVIWASLAPGQPGVGSTSPVNVAIDSNTSFDVDQPERSGTGYGTVLEAATATKDGQFNWYRLGSAQLSSGQHTVTITIKGAAPDTKRYTLGIDALCLSRSSIAPTSAERPAVE